MQHGVKFSGENLAEIVDLCAEESFKKALYQSADAFTAQDLENLYGCVDDELIIDVAKRYKVSAPADIADEYEEELCPDASTPISWSRFYDAFCDWKPEYAKARLQAVTGYGSDDDTIKHAVFLSKLLLTEESLEELYGNVDDNIIIQVAKEQNLKLPEDLCEEEEEELEELSFEIQSAIDAADYALECLVQAQCVLMIAAMSALLI